MPSARTQQYVSKLTPGRRRPTEHVHFCTSNWRSKTDQCVISGVFKIWQRGGHGERAEREPITGVWRRSPQRGPGAEPVVGGSGGEAP